MPLGRTIRAIREKHRLTTVEFASRLGINNGTVSRYENDKLSPGGRVLALLFRMADAGQREEILKETQRVVGIPLTPVAVEKLNLYMHLVDMTPKSERDLLANPEAAGLAKVAVSLIQEGRVDRSIVEILHLWDEFGNDDTVDAFRDAEGFLRLQLGRSRPRRKGR